MKAYFGACGIGFGHVGRCISIADRLKESGFDMLFSTYGEAVAFVRREGYPAVEAPRLSITTEADGRIDMKHVLGVEGLLSVERFLSQVSFEIKTMRSFRPDIVVSDTRLSTVVASNMLDIPTMLMLNQFHPLIPRERRFLRLSKVGDGAVLTVMSDMWGLADRIIIPDFPEPNTVSLMNMRIPQRHRGKVLFVGPILRRNPWDVKAPRDSGSEVKVFAPISGPSAERLPLVRLLLKLFKKFPGKFRIIMSMGCPDGNGVYVKHGNFTAYRWVEDRLGLMKWCDVVVSRAGHGTIMEAVSCGKPMVLIPTPGHSEQYGNARRAVEIGFAEAVEQYDLTAERLVEKVETVLNEESYRRKAEELQAEARRLGGGERVVQEIMSSLEG